jgi:signal transduction histidine kinase
MFGSIRWRLVISYVMVTLLTVAAVGVLTLSLVQRYAEQRVVEELSANADAIAQQAEPLMQPIRRLAALRELARTSAFLGGVQVRILDDQRRVLADSGLPSDVDQFMWLTSLQDLGLDHLDRSWIMVVPRGQRVEMALLQDLPFLDQLSRQVQWTVVSRVLSAWGPRITFEGSSEESPLSLRRRDANAEAEAEVEPTQPTETQRSEKVITASIGEPNDPLGYVELSSGPDFGAEALATTRRAFLLAAGGAMILAVIVGLLVSHGLTAPLRGLAATANRMGEDLSARAPVRGRDEISQLAQQLNHMAERLEVSFAALTADRDALRRFIADASHELRTPITALKNFNELLQGVAADDPAAQKEFLTESAAQLERLEWMTNKLLDLSRLDAGLAALELEEHDAGNLVRTASGPFAASAKDKGIVLSTIVPDAPVLLYCDAARVDSALSNLLSNALKFTPPGGRVDIGAQATDDGVQFWVQDTGPGIAPADQPHIFERFYRGQGNETDGSGLGLAIVASVAQAHGGSVRVESEPGQGSRFVMILPQHRTA